MFPFHKHLEPPFSWREKTVKIRISVGDAESFYEGTLKELYNDGLLIQTSGIEIFIPRSSIIAIEKVKT